MQSTVWDITTAGWRKNKLERKAANILFIKINHLAESSLSNHKDVSQTEPGGRLTEVRELEEGFSD